MVRGYHRRQAERWRHTRLLATTLYNVNRDPDSEALRPEDFMPLPGDELALTGPEMSEADYLAALAAVAALDGDLY